jgi:DNA-binding MarR family transcriptional regulator
MSTESARAKAADAGDAGAAADAAAGSAAVSAPAAAPGAAAAPEAAGDRAGAGAGGLTVDDGIRTLLRLMPRMVGRAKRIKIPEELTGFSLAPRHLSLFSYLLFDGPLSVNDLAARLEVAPATVSLMISDLAGQGILQRDPDPGDRRRTIVSITPAHHPAIATWLARGATAWRHALAPLTPAERRLFVTTLQTYESALAEDD